MKAIDIHAHISTKPGIDSLYKFSKALMEYYMKQEVSAEMVYTMAKSDEDMAQDFINDDVKGILVGWDAETNTGLPPVSHDYLAGVVKQFPEAFIGAFACVDPWKGEAAINEAERAIKELSMTKAYSVQIGFRALDRAIQTFGAMGFTNEMGLIKAWHSMRAVNVADGTNEILNRTIANRLLKGDLEL